MIDAHLHIWRLDRADYGWLTPALGPIYRDVTLEDWRAQSRPCGVTGGILVQAAPTEAETGFLLEQAAQAPDVLGVVGWTDLQASDAVLAIERLARQPKLKGLRPMLQDIADLDWILSPALAPALSAMSQQGLVFDALIKPQHIARILELARRYPDLRIVIDHSAKPDIARAQWDGWAQGMERLARDTTACCKLSGLWTEAGPDAPISSLSRYARHVLAVFDPRRVLWGSDWPVLELAGDYASWHRHSLGLVIPDRQGAVFSDNARRVYRL